MFKTVSEFVEEWKKESENTAKIISSLTDESLNNYVTEGHRTIGRVIWHIIQCIPEMCSYMGLKIEGPSEKEPVPSSAETIKSTYQKAANTLVKEIQDNWKDESMELEDNLYGEIWKRGATLDVLLKHEIHHRGQLTIMMRAAGLKVTGIYGPSKEEWVNFGASAPSI